MNDAGRPAVAGEAIFTVNGQYCYWVMPDGPNRPVTVADAKRINDALCLAADLLAALKAVVAISDRKHIAWDTAHAVIAKAEAGDGG